jgi:hypothetical protein
MPYAISDALVWCSPARRPVRGHVDTWRALPSSQWQVTVTLMRFWPRLPEFIDPSDYSASDSLRGISEAAFWSVKISSLGQNRISANSQGTVGTQTPASV